MYDQISEVLTADLLVWISRSIENVFLSNTLTELDILVPKYVGFLGFMKSNFKKDMILGVDTLFTRTWHIYILE